MKAEPCIQHNPPSGTCRGCIAWAEDALGLVRRPVPNALPSDAALRALRIVMRFVASDYTRHHEIVRDTLSELALENQK